MIPNVHTTANPRENGSWVRDALLAVGTITAGCSLMTADASGPSPARASEAGAQALAQIDRLIGQARCTSDEQCQVAGIGSRPCGGPESYRAWSTQTTDRAALEEWLRTYASERQRWQEKLGLMSTCEVRPVPGARCERPGSQAGICVLVNTSDAAR